MFVHEMLFNQDKVQKFKSTLNPKSLEIVNKILENTIYISTLEMIEMVRQSFNRFKQIYSKYNLFIPNNKVGSEHYILLQLAPELNPVQIIYGTNMPQSTFNKYPIIMFDDAIYSSINACGHVDTLRYILKLKNPVYIITAVLSSPDVQLLTDKHFKPVKIISHLDLEYLLPEYLFMNEGLELIETEKSYTYERLYTLFGCETQTILPLIFEHKIANAFGSYQFYHQIINTPVSRSKIDKITENDILDLISKLTIKK